MSAHAAADASIPWITIPRFPQTGQAYAFADRKEEVGRLFKAVVAAGNAALADQGGAKYRAVVSGYKGVGKSSVTLQVLGMIRAADGVVEGQRLTLPAELPEPVSRERWLILSASGKLVPSVDAIADALQKAVLSTLEEVEHEAERQAPAGSRSAGITTSSAAARRSSSPRCSRRS